jgi:multidrug resistance efflux pump
LRWAAGLGAVFALGIIATWIVQVGPRNRDLTQAREQLADAQRDLAEAQADLKRLSDLEQSNADLSHRLTLAEQRIDVLSALVAVTRAQAALGLGDETGARNALAEARRHLEDALLPAIEPGRRPQVEALLTRLELVLGELARDAFAAQSDLGVLANGLEELDAAMAEEGAG